MKSNKKSSLRWLKIGVVAAFIFIVSVAALLYKLAQLAKSLPDPGKSSNWQVMQSTKFYDKTGEVLLYETSKEGRRTVISFEEMTEYAKKATVAIEDQNFYSHSALDWKAIIRAFIKNLTAGEISQGGSTITQQLAKNAFLTMEKTLARKTREVILAFWIEKYYDKDRILELYLNQISYGAGAYGIEAASQIYFGRSTKDLSLVEAATLAAMPKSPSYYSPWGPHLNELLERKNYVLDQMFNLGFIDIEEKERGQKTAPVFIDKKIGSIKAPHFVMMVRDYLIEKYGEDFVNKKGLRVITSLDWNLQQIAERVVSEGAKRNTELYKGKNAALVAQDPKTGQILALVGSADYFDIKNDGNFNVAAQGLRQPGSAIKPIIYISAFKKGYTPNTIVFDLPTEFSSKTDVCPIINIDFKNPRKECYHPQNFDHQFRGPVNLRNALAQSINIPAVKVLYLVGLNDAVKTARDFGISTLNDLSRYGLSLVLGGGEVKLLELVGAYSVFSQDGIKHQQSAIIEVSDSSGEILEKYLDKAVQVIEPQYTRLINDILSDPEARKPLYQNSFGLTVFNDRDVALKTGTTDDFKDAWTMGYTPYLVVGVWAGNNKPEPMEKNAGSILAALPIWNAFMDEAIKTLPNESFIKPDFIAETKPMINGQFFINNQVHNILYYVDKNNPLGATPQNPGNDNQFLNWEVPVQIWSNQFSPYLRQLFLNIQSN